MALCSVLCDSVPDDVLNGLFYFCSEDELPAPTAHEEKVKKTDSGEQGFQPLFFQPIG